MKRSSQEFLYSVVLCLVFIGVASAGPKVQVPPNKEAPSETCPVEIPPPVWRWGQSLPGGPPFADRGRATIRLNCKDFELPDGTLLYDQYSIYALKRGKETADWWDLKDGKSYRSAMVLKNAGDSGELLQLLSVDGKEHLHVLNRRTSNFNFEKDFKNGAILRTALYKQVVFVLKTRERDSNFQAFVKKEVETQGIQVPIPFKPTVELLQAHLLDVLKLVNGYDLQKSKY